MGVKVREKPPGSGVWWLFVNHQGRRTSKKVGDLSTALEVARKVEAKIALEDFNIKPRSEPKKMPTFEKYAAVWLNGYIKALRRRSTYSRYEHTLNKHILPAFGKKPLDQITRGHVRDFMVAKIKKGYSRSSICLYRDVMSGIFNHAIDAEIIRDNPVKGITKRLELERGKKSKMDPLNRAELKLFLDTCQGSHSELYPLFLMAARTGMRLGELLAIQWGDVDFNSSFLWVRRSYRRGRLEATKNGKDRKVDMSNQLAKTLKQLFRQEKKQAMRDGRGEMSGLIFHRQGRPYEQNHVRRIFKRMLKKAEMREIRFHDLRHTFASLLLSQGETPVYVKDQLGHSSIQITVDIYGHLIPGSNKKAVDKLDDLDAPIRTLGAPATKTASN